MLIPVSVPGSATFGLFVVVVVGGGSGEDVIGRVTRSQLVRTSLPEPSEATASCELRERNYTANKHDDNGKLKSSNIVSARDPSEAAYFVRVQSCGGGLAAQM